MRAMKVFAAAVAMLFLAGCAGTLLRTAKAEPGEVEGTYRVILWGANHARDYESIAILDREGDAYSFDPAAPEYLYGVTEPMGGADALAVAEGHLAGLLNLKGTRLGRLEGPGGAVIGYEVRPVLKPFVHGTGDPLDVTYVLTDDGEVWVYMELKDEFRDRDDEPDGQE